MDILTLIYSVLLLYLLTQEASGNGVMVYYAAIQGKKKKSRAVHFQATYLKSFSCIYQWHFVGIWGKCKSYALSRMNRWHLESIKCGLKDPTEAPLISPSLSLSHTSTHGHTRTQMYVLSVLNINLCLLLPADVSRTPDYKCGGSQPAHSHWELVQEREESVQRARPCCSALQMLR